MTGANGAVAQLDDVTHVYGKVAALNAVTLTLPAARTVALIGPDGVGKSSLLGIIAGSRKVQSGTVAVLDGDMADGARRAAVCRRIAFMPQGLGKNLYPDLTVRENIEFFSRVFGQSRSERELRIAEVLAATGLAPFGDRLTKKLSGGMRQKLGLCCSLIHDPDLLILDEPTTGVDPLSRRQFWELIERIRSRRRAMSIVVATACMEEAERFDWLVALNAGKVLAAGTPVQLKAQTGARSVENAFIALLPERLRAGHRALRIPPRRIVDPEPVIAARDLTRRFGDFAAVDHLRFTIERGEIFGFVGSNGCGKTTTMKMLTGLLPASEGEALLFGRRLDASDLNSRRRIGYMSQSFSLYTELTVRQNLDLHARLFHLPAREGKARIADLIGRFALAGHIDQRAQDLPLGIRQRLSLAVAVVHEPEILILDEPTSGVDPLARDQFWELLIDLSRNRGVTIFVSTHFMNEAERCDRISLMDSGRVLAMDTPADLIRARDAATLEDAFIAYLEEASKASASSASGLRYAQSGSDAASQRTSLSALGGGEGWGEVGEAPGSEARRDPPHPPGATAPGPSLSPRERAERDISSTRNRATGPKIRGYPGVSAETPSAAPWRSYADTAQHAFSVWRLFACTIREALELMRDPIRLGFALFGTTFLIDQSHESRAYLEEMRGSPYFLEKPVLADYADLQRRLERGEISAGIEIPPGFGRDIARGRPVWVAAWVDGARPFVAQTIRGYLQGMHQLHLADPAVRTTLPTPPAAQIEIRFKYNQDFDSIYAMVPSTIALELALFRAILIALAIVRDKELGSITNLYVTPLTRIEFLVGKQLPYVAVAMVNFALMFAMALLVFKVPLKGSFPTLVLATLIYVGATTAYGMLISAFARTQIAALFGTAILTVLPATMFAGMMVPVSSLTGVAQTMGRLFPMTYFLPVSVGIFTKGLGFSDPAPKLAALALFIPVLTFLSLLLLRNQER